MKGNNMKSNKYQGFSTQYADIDTNGNIWLVCNQLGFDWLFVYYSDSDSLHFIDRIYKAKDIFSPYSYSVLASVPGKVIIAPYQSGESCFIEYDFISKKISKAQKPEKYIEMPKNTGGEEFVSAIKCKDKVLFFSNNTPAIIKYDLSTCEYSCCDILDGIVELEQWGIERAGVFLFNDDIYIVVSKRNIILKYDLEKNIVYQKHLPTNVHAHGILVHGGKAYITQYDSYDIVVWDINNDDINFIRGSKDELIKWPFCNPVVVNNKIVFPPYLGDRWLFVDSNSQKITITDNGEDKFSFFLSVNKNAIGFSSTGSIIKMESGKEIITKDSKWICLEKQYIDYVKQVIWDKVDYCNYEQIVSLEFFLDLLLEK